MAKVMKYDQCDNDYYDDNITDTYDDIARYEC